MTFLVVDDFKMANMKGDIASKKILEINPNINIILITSITDKKEIVNALKIVDQTINELKAK